MNVCSIDFQYGEIRPSDVVAVIESVHRPLGRHDRAPVRCAKIIAVDLDNARLAGASDVGATGMVNSGDPNGTGFVLALTDGLGADVAIDAVGTAHTFTMATVIVRPGGRRH